MGLRLQIDHPVMPPDDRRVYRQARLILAVLCLSVRLLGMARSFRILKVLPFPLRRPVGPLDSPVPFAAHVGEIVVAAATRGPFHPECLEISMTLWHLLHRRGIDGSLKLGARIEGRVLRGHAWLEVDGTVVSQLDDPSHHFPGDPICFNPAAPTAPQV